MISTYNIWNVRFNASIKTLEQVDGLDDKAVITPEHVDWGKDPLVKLRKRIALVKLSGRIMVVVDTLHEVGFNFGETLRAIVG